MTKYLKCFDPKNDSFFAFMHIDIFKGFLVDLDDNGKYYIIGIIQDSKEGCSFSLSIGYEDKADAIKDLGTFIEGLNGLE